MTPKGCSKPVFGGRLGATVPRGTATRTPSAPVWIKLGPATQPPDFAVFRAGQHENVRSGSVLKGLFVLGRHGLRAGSAGARRCHSCGSPQ